MLDGDDKRPPITLVMSTTVSRLSNFQRVDYEGAVKELLLVQGSVESHLGDRSDPLRGLTGQSDYHADGPRERFTTR